MNVATRAVALRTLFDGNVHAVLYTHRRRHFAVVALAQKVYYVRVKTRVRVRA
jgi:hypothetical protein